jgi:hypothetical protein
MKNARGTTPSKTEGILDRSLGDDIVVLSPDGKVLHTLSGTACFIWGMIDGSRSIDEIASAITDEYQIDEETARRDIHAFLTELEKLRLIAIPEK